LAFVDNLYLLIKDRSIIGYYFYTSDDLDDIAANFDKISGQLVARSI